MTEVAVAPCIVLGSTVIHWPRAAEFSGPFVEVVRHRHDPRAGGHILTAPPVEAVRVALRARTVAYRGRVILVYATEDAYEGLVVVAASAHVDLGSDARTDAVFAWVETQDGGRR